MSFIKQTLFQVDYAPAHITKWKSSRTGLQLVYINQPSPIVNGYFAVATEIEDNSGCPHTLEHLVFMGSKKYPYKGLLDNLGNRLYSNTNAWTAVDQTVYTLVTAGWEGFKLLLPVYLDHLLDPTLTDEACLTEVYHVDENGEEKGVVFSEMQAIETQSWFISLLKMQETLFGPKSGYSSETGGLLLELRTLTNDKIRKFHELMYRPDNLAVVITGTLDVEELLEVMEKFDEHLAPISNKPRPFVDSKEDLPLKETLVVKTEFPLKDESMGELLISWIGPKSTDTLVNLAVDMVGTFFTDSAISLFTKTLVEIDEPYATDVDYSTDDYFRTVLNFTVNGIPTEKLFEVDCIIKDLVFRQTKPENIDVTYLREIITQQKIKFTASTERSPSKFANIAIGHFIYGNPDGSDLPLWIKSLDEFDVLLKWTPEQWAELINNEFVKNHSATVLASPSAALNKLQKRQLKELHQGIKDKHGAEGLAKLGEDLKKAQLLNDLPIPDGILYSFEKPDPTKIDFIKTKSYYVGDSSVLPKGSTYEKDSFSEELSKDTSPLFIHFEDYKSQFTSINIVTSTADIPARLLPYYSILEELFSLSVQLPGEYIPFDKVISELNNDLIEFNVDNGYDGAFNELINVRVKFESVKYSTAVQWVLNIMKYSVFEESRVKIILDKLVNSLSDKKRNGELMMYSSKYRHLFNEKALRKAQDSIQSEHFFKGLLEKINDGGFEEIKHDLEEFRNLLFQLDNMKAFVVGNALKLIDPVKTWNDFTSAFAKPNLKPVPFGKLPRSFEFLSEVGARCSKDAFLVATPAAKSTHLISVTKSPTDYLSPDQFKIALATEFLIAVEGPLWRGIRGTGLAYGASISRSVETGFLSFLIYRGADPKQALTVAKSIIEDYANGVSEIDELSLENAIALIINGFANAEDNNYDAASEKIIDNLFKQRGPEYITYFLKQVNALTLADVQYALRKYFVRMFDAEHSVIFSSVPSEQSEDFSEFFTEQGYNVTSEEIQTDGGEALSGCPSDCESHDHGDSEEETDSESEDETPKSAKESGEDSGDWEDVSDEASN